VSKTKIAIADDPAKALVKAIAMDIGKEVVHYVEGMYPQAISATSSTFRLSLRNCIYNEIMAALEVNDEGKIIARLKANKDHRRKMNAMRKVLNETDWEAYREKVRAAR
jgi:hypothetical protein